MVDISDIFDAYGRLQAMADPFTAAIGAALVSASGWWQSRLYMLATVSLAAVGSNIFLQYKSDTNAVAQSPFGMQDTYLCSMACVRD